MIEKTLIVLKPDAVQRAVCWEIIARFERAWLKLVWMKMLSPDRDFLYYHYETIGTVITRRGQKAFDALLTLMMSGPVVALVLEWVEAVTVVRKLVWSTEPKTAAPGTIRWDYAHLSFAYADISESGQLPNLIHASWDSEEAVKEVAHWFRPEELVSYTKDTQKRIYG